MLGEGGESKKKKASQKAFYRAKRQALVKIEMTIFLPLEEYVKMKVISDE